MTPLLVFIHLPGDVAVLGPIAAAARARGAPFRIALPESFWDRSRPAQALCAWLGVTPKLLPDAGPAASWADTLRPCDTLLTGTESTLKPHRAAHELTRALQSLGARAFTLQHGLENIGVSYFDAIQGPEVRFAADRVLIWGDVRRLPLAAPSENVAKMQTVGRGTYGDLDRPPSPPWPEAAPASFDVVVFENLHWHRYDEVYRTAFLRDVQALAASRPDLSVAIKPHPQGRWLTQRFKGERPAASNLFIADPADPVWADIDAERFIARSRLVLTTPSTTALDAAQAAKPTAVFAYGLDLPLYAPLPLLNSGDVEAFVQDALDDPTHALQLTRRFVADTLAPGDAAARILDIVSAA